MIEEKEAEKKSEEEGEGFERIQQNGDKKRDSYMLKCVPATPSTQCLENGQVSTGMIDNKIRQICMTD